MSNNNLTKEDLVDLILQSSNQITELKVQIDELKRKLKNYEVTQKKCQKNLFDMMMEDGVLEEKVGNYEVKASQGRGSLVYKDGKTIDDVPNYLVTTVTTKNLDKVHARRELDNSNDEMNKQILRDLFEIEYTPTVKIKEL